MMPPGPNLQAYLQQLGKAHGFTFEQLAANRQRVIHPSQLVRGRGSGIVGGIVLVFFALATFAGGIGGSALLYDDLREPISRVDMNGVYALAGGGVIIGLLFVAAAVSSFRAVGRRRGAYERGDIRAVEGPAQKVHIRRGRSADSFRVHLGDQRFELRRDTWELITHGARYRAYYVMEDLLSIEPA